MSATYFNNLLFFFFFKDPATTEIYTLSLHDALPILRSARASSRRSAAAVCGPRTSSLRPDRKSTRLNSSHVTISYAVFCLNKKNDRRTILAAEARQRRVVTKTLDSRRR